jgi:hypothetical protein
MQDLAGLRPQQLTELLNKSNVAFDKYWTNFTPVPARQCYCGNRLSLTLPRVTKDSLADIAFTNWNFLISWLPGFGGNAEVLEPEYFFHESPVFGYASALKPFNNTASVCIH